MLSFERTVDYDALCFSFGNQCNFIALYHLYVYSVCYDKTPN
jgi:hypothetical protein